MPTAQPPIKLDYLIDTGDGFTLTEREPAALVMPLVQEAVTASVIVPPIIKKPRRTARARAPRLSCHMVTVSCPATTNMAGYIATCLVKPGIPGLAAGDIIEVKMTERGKRALIIASVIYPVANKKMSRQLPRKLKKALQCKIETFYRGASLINGKGTNGKVHVEVNRHDKRIGIFDSSASGPRGTRPYLMFSLSGPGGRGELAALIEAIRASANRDINVTDLYGKQHRKDSSITEVLVQLSKKTSDSPQNIATTVAGTLAAKLPGYDVRVSAVHSALALFGHDTQGADGATVEIPVR